jgi:hypothetical protein
VNSIAEAQILIADGDDISGKEFANSWRNEPGKVVLDQQWIYVSERHGEWPDEENNWGGFCLNQKEVTGKDTETSNRNEDSWYVQDIYFPKF